MQSPFGALLFVVLTTLVTPIEFATPGTGLVGADRLRVTRVGHAGERSVRVVWLSEAACSVLRDGSAYAGLFGPDRWAGVTMPATLARYLASSGPATSTTWEQMFADAVGAAQADPGLDRRLLATHLGFGTGAPVRPHSTPPEPCGMFTDMRGDAEVQGRAVADRLDVLAREAGFAGFCRH